MDYYQKKKFAFSDIDRLYRNGVSKAKIVYKIQTAYGFGENIVEDRIRILENAAEANEKAKLK